VAPLEAAVTDTKLRVLVVDDNADAAESLAHLLSIFGHESRVAYSGAAALAIMHEFKPALVFLDIGMPGMNGYETAGRIRADDPSGLVVLAALTGWGAEADRIRAKEAGFDHHFTKPVEPAKVNSVLHLVALRQSKSATA
jgi:CheY-like chemotaxis protein